MELIDTIDGMTSTDYKERFKAEYQQLNIRSDKLKSFIKDYSENKLNFTPSTPIYVLETQLYYMRSYLSILRKRAIYEGINLD